MVSKTLFVLGMFPVGVMYCGFLLCLLNKEIREMGTTTASQWNSIITIASGALLLLSAIIAHTLGW